MAVGSQTIFLPVVIQKSEYDVCWQNKTKKKKVEDKLQKKKAKTSAGITPNWGLTDTTYSPLPQDLKTA